MEKYTEDVVCKKCGSPDVEVTYMAGKTYVRPEALEKLRCNCRRCGYGWNMEPKN